MEKWISNYLDKNGKLNTYPSKRKYKIASLFYITSKLDSEKEYTERELNEAINAVCNFKDPALLRREMYNYFMISRTADGTKYWVEKEQPDPKKYDL